MGFSERNNTHECEMDTKAKCILRRRDSFSKMAIHSLWKSGRWQPEMLMKLFILCQDQLGRCQTSFRLSQYFRTTGNVVIGLISKKIRILTSKGFESFFFKSEVNSWNSFCVQGLSCKTDPLSHFCWIYQNYFCT